MASDRPQALQMPTAYPAVTKQVSGFVDETLTHVTSMLFADKIMVTITQSGRLAQWIHVPLDTANPSFADQQLPSSTDENGLLPMPHLTPKTLLGGSTSERETIGQLYATHIASAIATKNPQENRTILIGLGLSKAEANRQVFYDTIDLVMASL
ncbi:hypothetical protein MMC07_001116 [Pseudocyphellaria aurata]|nr:hypothetical protein [Pseudocyphellaria aurata]